MEPPTCYFHVFTVRALICGASWGNLSYKMELNFSRPTGEIHWNSLEFKDNGAGWVNENLDVHSFCKNTHGHAWHWWFVSDDYTCKMPSGFLLRSIFFISYLAHLSLAYMTHFESIPRYDSLSRQCVSTMDYLTRTGVYRFWHDCLLDPWWQKSGIFIHSIS